MSDIVPEMRRVASAWTALLVGGALVAAPGDAEAITPGSSFDVDTEIIGLDLAGVTQGALGPIVGPIIGPLDLDPLGTVGTTGSGNALTAPDPDAELLGIGATVGIPLASVDVGLGVLGVEWIDQDTFELVFNLSTQIDVELLSGLASVGPINADISAISTIDWEIAGITFDDERTVITGVEEDASSTFNPSPTILLLGDNSFRISYNNLVGVAAGISGNTLDGRARFNLSTATVPLPAAGWLMLAGIGGLALRARRNRPS